MNSQRMTGPPSSRPKRALPALAHRQREVHRVASVEVAAAADPGTSPYPPSLSPRAGSSWLPGPRRSTGAR
jgi:hypothetical protein